MPSPFRTLVAVARVVGAPPRRAEDDDGEAIPADDQLDVAAQLEDKA